MKSRPNLIVYCLFKLIKLYQKLHLGKSCRFSPTCSEYAYQALGKYGIVKGSLLSFKRIIRCRPGQKAGYDPLL